MKKLPYLIPVLLVAFLGLCDGASCPSEFVQNGTYCYFFSHDRENWIGAKTMCESQHAYLAEPYTVAEGSYLSSQAKAHRRFYWIGANDIAVQGTWVWAKAETPVSNINWYPSRPDNNTEVPGCAVLQSDGSTYDVQCHQYATTYVCQKALSDPQLIG